MSAGGYELTLDELRASKLVLGPADPAMFKTWDAAWRSKLVDRLEILVSQLWSIGIGGVFVNGSFVEDKAHPNDIDGYFDCDPMRFASGQLKRDLNALDPKRAWGWEHALRRAHSGDPKLQLPMWHA